MPEVDLMTGQFHSHASASYLLTEFMNGLNAQRHKTVIRIHHNCAPILGVSERDLVKPDISGWNAKFCDEIGWVSKTGLYPSIGVLIIHKIWHGDS